MPTSRFFSNIVSACPVEFLIFKTSIITFFSNPKFNKSFPNVPKLHKKNKNILVNIQVISKLRQKKKNFNCHY